MSGKSWRAVFAAWLLSFAALDACAGVDIVSARVWPAADYTRVTLESPAPIQYKFFSVKNPERLVVDLEGVDLTATLQGLSAKIGAADPYIKLVRVGRFQPNVVRVVLDLKGEIKPQVFTLAPNGMYGHRLVLDIYPQSPADPMMALLDRPDDKPAPAQDEAPKQAPADKDSPKKADEGAKKLNVDRLVTIAIDAGHGGEDPGARGRRGSNEKDVTLAIARRLKAQVDAEPGMRAVLTRDGDYFIPLHTRVVKARAVQADLFVSIHADAFINADARGSSVFALSERGATSVAARWLAKRENEADLIGGVNIKVKDPYLAQTLLDLSQTATINDSLKLGRAVLGELGGINRLHKGSVEQAGFAVLKSPDIPSILVETAFISNPEEEQRLTDDDYQAKMAAAILGGIKRYFAKNPPLAKSRLAQKD